MAIEWYHGPKRPGWSGFESLHLGIDKYENRTEQITAWWSFQPPHDEMILVRVQPFSNGYRDPRCGVRSQTTTIVVRFGLVSHNAAHNQRQRPFQCRFLQPFFHSRLSLPFSRSLTLSLPRSNASSLFLLSRLSVCFCQIIPAFQFFSLFILLTAVWSEP